MGAANFQTMRDFSLYARDFSDEIEYYDICDIVQSDLDDVNRDLLFHKITMQSGYYTGVQFYVEAEHDLGEYDYDNEECHYYFDCCRSVAYRKYQYSMVLMSLFVPADFPTVKRFSPVLPLVPGFMPLCVKYNPPLGRLKIRHLADFLF